MFGADALDKAREGFNAPRGILEEEFPLLGIKLLHVSMPCPSACIRSEANEP